MFHTVILLIEGNKTSTSNLKSIKKLYISLFANSIDFRFFNFPYEDGRVERLNKCKEPFVVHKKTVNKFKSIQESFRKNGVNWAINLLLILLVYFEMIINLSFNIKNFQFFSKYFYLENYIKVYLWAAICVSSNRILFYG